MSPGSVSRAKQLCSELRLESRSPRSAVGGQMALRAGVRGRFGEHLDNNVSRWFTGVRDAPGMNSAVRAATEVAGQFRIMSTDPVLLQETNNTVVWLRPEPVVAKVAVRAHSQDEVRLEHAVAVELKELGAEIARPVPGTRPVQHAGTGFVVTLWNGSRDQTELQYHPNSSLAHFSGSTLPWVRPRSACHRSMR